MRIESAICGSAVEIREADEGDAVAGGSLDPVVETPAPTWLAMAPLVVLPFAIAARTEW